MEENDFWQSNLSILKKKDSKLYRVLNTFQDESDRIFYLDRTRDGDVVLSLEEEQKKILLEQKKLYYEQQLTECLHDTLDMPRIKQYEQAVEDMKICIREQQHIIKQQEEKVAKARKKLDDAMKERKTYEKLKERAFEEFKLELNAAEQKEVDELVSFRHGSKIESED